MPVLNLLFGLGIFLFGMSQLESSIHALGSPWIKNWLSKTTSSPLSSVAGGTFITAMLQSSSVVSLLILAFAAAGMIPLYNAIGVLLGANLGTTFTGWIVATIGFKVDLSAASIPLLGTGCLLLFFFDKVTRWRSIGNLLLSFGLLLFGLDFMKTSVEHLPQQFDLNILQHLSPLGFVLFGCLLCAVIQSSSASMMIALAALHGEVLNLPSAAALIIGADLGTTSTTLLGSLRGFAIKRQLAMAHVMFNLVVAALAFIVLLPALPAIMTSLGISDPLYSLVAFHSLMNFLGLLIFTPVLKPYARWLGTLFNDKEKPHLILRDIAVTPTDAALAACESHLFNMLMAGVGINMRNLKIDPHGLNISNSLQDILDGSDDRQSFENRYEQLKQNEGELIQYIRRVQQCPLTERQSATLLRCLSCARDLVYSVKTLKDIRADLIDLRHQSEPELFELSTVYAQYVHEFYQKLVRLLDGIHEYSYLQEQLEELNVLNEQLPVNLNNAIDNNIMLSPDQLSTLMNVNRELHYSGTNLLQAVNSWYQ